MNNEIARATVLAFGPPDAAGDAAKRLGWKPQVGDPVWFWARPRGEGRRVMGGPYSADWARAIVTDIEVRGPSGRADAVVLGDLLGGGTQPLTVTYFLVLENGRGAPVDLIDIDDTVWPRTDGE